MDQKIWECSFMQKYVVTVDIGMSLKKSGWNRKTAFQWYTNEFMNYKWVLGKIDNELVMVPAPIIDEILESFDRKDLSITVCNDGFLVSLCSGESVKKYRLVDALAGLWVLKNK